MNVTDHIRQQMYRRMGIDTQEKRQATEVSAEIAGMTAKLEEIVGLARPRLIMGGVRYGSKWNHDDLMAYMQKKFDSYKETGNFEMLIDLFNFIPIEGKLKTHPKFHFKAVDRKE